MSSERGDSPGNIPGFQGGGLPGRPSDGPIVGRQAASQEGESGQQEPLIGRGEQPPGNGKPLTPRIAHNGSPPGPGPVLHGRTAGGTPASGERRNSSGPATGRQDGGAGEQAGAESTQGPTEVADPIPAPGDSSGDSRDGGGTGRNRPVPGDDGGHGDPRGRSAADDGADLAFDDGVVDLVGDVEAFLAGAVDNGDAQRAFDNLRVDKESRPLLELAATPDPEDADPDMAVPNELPPLERLFAQKDEAVQSIAQIAQDALAVSGEDKVTFHSEYSHFVAQRVPFKPTGLEEGIDSEIEPERQFESLLISSTHDLHYEDPTEKGKYEPFVLKVNFIYVIPSGEAAQAKLLSLNGEWLPAYTEQSQESPIAQNQEAKDAILEGYLSEHADGKKGIDKGEVEDALMAIIASKRAQAIEFKHVVEMSEVHEDGEIPGIELSERDARIAAAQRKILADQVFQLSKLDQEDYENNAAALGEAVTNLMALRADEASVYSEWDTNESEQVVVQLDKVGNDSEDGEVARAFLLSTLRGTAKNLGDLPPTVSARINLLGAVLFHEEASRQKLELQLSQERDRAERKAADPATIGPVKREILDAVVKECERLDLDPTDLIEKYGGNWEAQWVQLFNHYKRLHDEGVVDPKNKLGDMVEDVLAKGIISEETAIAVMPDALSVSDVDTKVKLINRFTEIMKNGRPTYERFTTLVQVGEEALAVADTDTILKIDDFISEVAGDLPDEMREKTPERKQILDEVAQEREKWTIRKKVALGDDRATVIRYIRNESVTLGEDEDDADFLKNRKEHVEEQPEVSPNVLFATAAEQYIAQDDFESAQVMLLNMKEEEPEVAEEAYLRFWYMAGTQAQVRELNPFDHPWLDVRNPRLVTGFKDATTLYSDIVPDIADRAEKIAQELQAGDESPQDITRGNPRWQRLERFVNRIRDLEGIDAAQEISRKILRVLAKKGMLVDIAQLRPYIDEIASTGEQGDIDLVKGVIVNQPLPAIEKAQLLTEFALKLY